MDEERASESVATLTELHEQVEELRVDNQRLHAEVAHLSAAASSGAESGRSELMRRRLIWGRRGSDRRLGDAPVSRRRMFGLLGGAAAAGTGLAITGSTFAADRAAAVDGTAMVVGANVNSDPGVTTTLSGSTAGDFTGMFDVVTSATGANSHALAGRHDGVAGYATGVYGLVTSTAGGGGQGVLGRSFADGGIGVWGDHPAGPIRGAGVYASAATVEGVGMRARSQNGATVVLVDDQVDITLPKFWSAGSLVNSFGVLWYCIAEGIGTQAQWVALSHGALVTLPSPVRVYDSRPGANPTDVGPKVPMEVEEDRLVDMTLNSSGVPANASSVLLNLAVTGTGPSGFLGLFKDGIPYPGNANINWSLSNQNLSNAVTSAVANNAKLRIHCGGSATDAVVDVVGYYL